jgi:hypothetical protein
MTDIVEWLRAGASNEWNGELLTKAADEIERLRALVPDWQSVETAPTTGLSIVWDGRYMWMADEPEKYPTENDGRSAAYHGVTHWMRPPPPPAMEESADGLCRKYHAEAPTPADLPVAGE